MRKSKVTDAVMVRESMRNAYIINPLRDGTVLMAVAVWYVGSEQPRLLGLRRRVIGNMLAAVFILRLINRWRRARLYDYETASDYDD